MRSVWTAQIEDLVNVPSVLSSIQAADVNNEIVLVIALDDLKALIVWKKLA